MSFLSTSMRINRRGKFSLSVATGDFLVATLNHHFFGELRILFELGTIDCSRSSYNVLCCPADVNHVYDLDKQQWVSTHSLYIHAGAAQTNQLEALRKASYEESSDYRIWWKRRVNLLALNKVVQEK